jgi:hypothetical protein
MVPCLADMAQFYLVILRSHLHGNVICRYKNLDAQDQGALIYKCNLSRSKQGHSIVICAFVILHSAEYNSESCSA